MKICPKCSFPSESSTECDKCGTQFGDVRTAKTEKIDLYCPFNDHGKVCGKRGSVSDSVLGAGPWYCSEHYWQLKGRIMHAERTPMPSELREKLKHWTAAYGLPPRAREPGDDDDLPVV